MDSSRSNLSPQPIVRVNGLGFRWPGSDTDVLSIDEFSVDVGEHLFVMGPSGSGKSTLLGLLTGIHLPQRGEIEVCGHKMKGLSGVKRDSFRADYMGYIFQIFNLIPYLSVIENVILPCRFSALKRKRISEKVGAGQASLKQEALRLLKKLNLADPTILAKPVVELSVGQQQRVAAARALMGSPELIIADEPTSALDADHRERFLNLLFEECDRIGATLIFVSHDPGLAPLFHRTLHLHDINRASVLDQKTGEKE